MMRKIKHQTQPNNNSCCATAVAIILGVDVQKVIDEFHNDYREGVITPGKYLESKGVEVRKGYTEEELDHEKLYILLVPSLSNKGVNHVLVLDTRGDEVRVFDPLKGFEDSCYYVWDLSEEERTEKEFNIRGRSVYYEILGKNETD